MGEAFREQYTKLTLHHANGDVVEVDLAVCEVAVINFDFETNDIGLWIRGHISKQIPDQGQLTQGENPPKPSLEAPPTT